jgi:hypothetical protein
LSRIKYIFAAIILVLAAASPALAQSGGYAGEFTRMGFSPRGMAMGNAMSAVHQQGVYAYYNPALAAISSESVQADLSTAALRFDRRLHMASVHVHLPPMAGLSISVMNARVSDIDGRSSSGYHTGMLSTAEYQVSAGFGLQFHKRFLAGLGIKYNLADYHRDIASTGSIGLDIGILIKATDRLAAAFTIKDFLSGYEIDSSGLYGTERTTDGTLRFPLRIISGVSYTVSGRWLLSADLERRLAEAERLTTVTVDQNGFSVPVQRREPITEGFTYLRTGTAFDAHERVTARIGLQWADAGGENLVLPSFGFSLNLPFDRYTPSIDYAFVREPNQLTNMHVFSLRLNI